MLITLVLAAVSLVVSYQWNRSETLPKGVTQEEYQQSAAKYRQLFRGEPSHDDILMLVAEYAAQENRHQVALDCFAQIPADHEKYGANARLQEGQVLLRMNLAIRAESSFRQYLAMEASGRTYPEHVRLAREFLAYLLSVELRLDERREILVGMARDGQLDVFLAKQLFFPTLLIWKSGLGSNRVREFLEKDPDHLILLTADARYLIAEGKVSEARRHLEALEKTYPADALLTAAMLECYFEQNDWAAIKAKLTRVTENEAEEPWVTSWIRGELALQEERWSDAANDFRRVISQDPANPMSHVGLAHALEGQERHEEAESVRRRSLTLAEVRVNLAAANRQSSESVRDLAESARQLNMPDAAEAFDRLAARMEAGQG